MPSIILSDLYEQKVYLDTGTPEAPCHTYKDQQGNRYLGFSSFSEFFFPAFKKDFIADRVAKSEKSKENTKEEVLALWQSKTDNGSRIDKALELKAKGFTLSEEYADIEKLVDDVLLTYNDYHSCYEQAVVYNEHFRIAGSPDKFMLSSARKDSRFFVSDFKAFESQDLHEHRGWLLSPFEHLPKTKFIKIILQTTFYAYQLEHLLGRKCGGLFIHLIDPINHTHQKIPIPYMRTDIEVALAVYKEKILSLVYDQSYEAF